MNLQLLFEQTSLMFFEMDLLSKIIISILVIFSVISWTIIFEKTFRFTILKSKTNKFFEIFWSGKNIYDIYEKYKENINCPIVSIFIEVMKELKNFENTKEATSLEYVSDKIYDLMSVSISKSIQKLRSGMTFMNVVASTSTYFGLLGMVWNVSQSFKIISIMKEATLTNLAPGINTSLIVTVVGLVSAIPALIDYQVIGSKINNIEEDLNNFSLGFLGILTKEMEKDEDE